MKQYYVAKLREGDKIEDVFLIASRSVAEARNGSTYIRLRLADKTGEVDAFRWNATESDVAKINEADFVLIRASVRIYQDNLQITIDSFQPVSDVEDSSDFMRASVRDPDEMMAELRRLLKEVSRPHLSDLLSAFFDDDGFVRDFRRAPAAQRVHHAYISGLLEHTLNVTRACACMAGLYPNADKDLLLAGAALHDVGKTREYEWTGAIKYSEEGHLVGHVVTGAMMVKQAAERIDGFDRHLDLALQHMLLSHHGNKEWGAPKRPKSIEAMMLHIADLLDSQLGIMEQAIEESDESGGTGLFTKKNPYLDRPVFKGLRERSDATDEQSDEDARLDLG